MKTLPKIIICCLACITFTSPIQAMTLEEFIDKPKHGKQMPIPEETIHHWEIATEYKYNRRFELARQHLLLALATCNSTELRNALQRELQRVDLQIRTMR